MTTRVFVLDDHDLLRRGVVQLIDAEEGLEVVGESSSVRGTLARIAATLPDVVLLDVHLPDGNGVDLCRDIRSAFPDTHCVILTGYDEETARAAAVLAGASGYVVKTIRSDALVAAIHRAARGERLLSRGMIKRVYDSASAQVPDFGAADVALSLRERQALELITQGLTNRQIGASLGIAEKTVKNYVSTLLAKLGMERRTQVAAYGATMHARRTP